MFRDKRYLEAAVGCGEVVWRRGLLRKGYGLCHGVAGNTYTFLQLLRLTNNPQYFYRALKVCVCVCVWYVTVCSVHTHICVCVCMCYCVLCMHARVCVCVCAHMHACVCVCVQLSAIYSKLHGCMFFTIYCAVH